MQTDQVFLAALYLLAPAGLVLLALRVSLFAKVGPIVLCYAAGLLLGLTGLLPESGAEIRTSITEASLGLALPLLLFAVDVRAWGHVAGRAMLSMLLAVIAVVALATALYHLFTSQGVERVEQLSGMAVGMYTGGIANMGAIKLALGIPDARYLLFATVDTVVGSIYLLFVLTMAPRVLGGFLPGFTTDKNADPEPLPTEAQNRSGMVVPGLVAFSAAVLCVGLAVVLAPMLPFANPQILTIVLLTTFGIAGSFLPALRLNRAAPHMGMYLIYVFSFCVAASMDLTALAGMDMSILVFCVAATFGSFALHALLARFARIDRDTFLITSVAAVMSPAFVPMVSRSLRNPAILMSGMATGILGFAIGNYLGISLALLLAGKG
ncbi:hypothetical protein AVO45_15920 [Ruegeria marisrubri]|uniref:Beta-carotene 15,15'-monooxygenase n=1 Tax=Ruegeria marisrubri TaxID=1685379 RepID=A0A0X3TJ39_9RHOB|nr:DUF819 family protein [Ruegeria marisrubri]KUJ73220.1 hypothetical protein AVO45_15920 [Ruegeria marisrubri]